MDDDPDPLPVVDAHHPLHPGQEAGTVEQTHARQETLEGSENVDKIKEKG